MDRPIQHILFPLVLSVFIVLVPALSAQGQKLREIKVCVPELSETFSYMQIGKESGFYRSEGFDVKVDAMKGVVCGQALASRGIDFAGSPSVLHMILRGLPYRIVFVAGDRLAHTFIAPSTIKGFADLRGKNVAIDGPGGLIDTMTRTILNVNGINADKEVKLITIGRPQDRELAIRGGSIAGALLSPTSAVRMLDEGFKELQFSPIVQMSGPLGAKTEMLQKEPDFVYRFLKASLKGHLLFGRSSNDILPMVMNFIGVKDRDYMKRLMEIRLKRSYNGDGILDEGAMREVIETTASQLGVPAKAPSEVFDFALLRRAMTELERENFSGLFRK